MNKMVNIYSFMAVVCLAERRMITLKKVIGLINRLQSQQLKRGIIDPAISKKKSEAFSLLNKWRWLYRVVEEEDFYTYRHKGMPFLDAQLGEYAWRFTSTSDEPDGFEIGRQLECMSSIAL